MKPCRRVLLTGATRGIGRELARQLSAQGVELVVGVRDLCAGKVEPEALVTPNPEQYDPSRGPSGWYELSGEPAVVEASARAQDVRLGRRLWDTCERLTRRWHEQ